MTLAPPSAKGATPDELTLIVDCGSQVTALIARRLREAGHYCEIHPVQGTDPALLDRLRPRAIIVSGGPSSLQSSAAPRPHPALFTSGLPTLGICFGQQAMVEALGGAVETGASGEFGPARVRLANRQANELFAGWFEEGDEEPVWMSHGDRVVALPPGFEVLAISDGAPLAAIAAPERKLYGVQFHPEVAHTPRGALLLSNFVGRIAGLAGGWTMGAYRNEAVATIRRQVGQGAAVCGLSGGVDSAVAALLVHEAIGDRLACIFIDTGLLRQGEADQVVGLFEKTFDIPLIRVEAGDRFLDALRGVTEPEEKRRCIGRLFVRLFESEARRFGGAEFLVQGTLYPDVIESVSPDGGPSVAIKSHHNVGGLPARMGLRLVEPLRRLFKDEVRALGRELDLPEAFVGRHPFPGPGLAIRTPGETTRERVAILRRADAIYLEEIRAAGLYDRIWQAFAVLLPVRSVGVKGDGRSYEEVLTLRAVTSSDGMTAECFSFESSFLRNVSARLVNEVPGVNRVLLDLTSKPPGTIEWE